MYPGSCLIGDKIFFVGGQRKAHSGKLKSSKYVYSLDLTNESFILKMENIKAPVKVIYPRIAAGNNQAILLGGKHPKTEQLNKYIFQLHFEETGMKFIKLDDLAIDITENYPPIIKNDSAIFISFPNVAVRKRDATN